MYRTSFPDLNWLKAEISKSYRNQAGWPSKILHVHTAGQHRPDVDGPLSLFFNIRGSSVCRSESHPSVRVSGDFYFISNPRERYSLEIDEETETFNIHLGDHLVNTLLRDYSQSSAQLLDNYTAASPAPQLFSKLYCKDDTLDILLNRLYRHRNELNTEELLEEELLAYITHHLLHLQREELNRAHRLPAANAATRMELYKRLHWAYDYLQTHYKNPVTLDELAGIACLSRYHFLRLFRSLFGCSPHQMLLRIRMQRAHDLICNTREPVGVIALKVGFDNQSSFNRAFTRQYRHAPLVLRPAGAVAV